MADVLRSSYEVLGIAARPRPRRSSGPTAAWPASCTPTPTRDPEAEARFKEVAHAYEVLTDPERRQRYDTLRRRRRGRAAGRTRSAAAASATSSTPSSAAARSAAGRAARRPRPAQRARPRGRRHLDFEEAVFGDAGAGHRAHRGRVRRLRGLGRHARARRPTTCTECGGSRPGAPGPPVDPRPDGHRRPLPPLRGAGQIIDAPLCPTAAARAGHRGADLHRRRPRRRRRRPGRAPRRSGRGRPPRRAGPATCTSTSGSGPTSGSSGTATTCSASCPSRSPRPRWAPTCGFETLDGDEDLVIAPGTQTGQLFRLRGRGVPHVEGRGRGDLLVQVVVETPTELSSEEEELLRRLAELRGEDVAPPDEGFFSKIRSAFK